jgi:hypothetical protein
VEEAKRGIVDDVTRNDKVVRVLDLACYEVGNSVVVDPDLRDNVISILAKPDI